MKINPSLIALVFLVSLAVTPVEARRRPNRQPQPTKVRRRPNRQPQPTPTYSSSSSSSSSEEEYEEGGGGTRVVELPERYEGNCDYEDITYGQAGRLTSVGSGRSLGWQGIVNANAILTSQPLNFRIRSDMRLEVVDNSPTRNCIEVINHHRGGQILVEPCDCYNPLQIMMMLRVPQMINTEYALYAPESDYLLVSNGGSLDTGDPRDLEDPVLSDNDVWSLSRSLFRA